MKCTACNRSAEQYISFAHRTCRATYLAFMFHTVSPSTPVHVVQASSIFSHSYTSSSLLFFTQSMHLAHSLYAYMHRSQNLSWTLHWFSQCERDSDREVRRRIFSRLRRRWEQTPRICRERNGDQRHESPFFWCRCVLYTYVSDAVSCDGLATLVIDSDIGDFLRDQFVEYSYSSISL